MITRLYNNETVAIPLQIFKGKEEKQNMKTNSLHRQLISKQAKVPACMSAYWSQFSNSGLGNDRTPEITIGSLEDSVS